MDELEELIDLPYERLEVEYKDWLDLSDEVMRAKVARCVAALANFGGGYVVFGIDDRTLTPTGANPYHHGYTADDIHGILRAYLEPMVQVIVRQVRSNKVLLVPPHGAVPVCSKKNGPGDDKGKPREIVRGVYYTRKVGPESAPIISEADWIPIIRRCVMHDKSALFAAVSSALGATQASPIDHQSQLDLWHRAMRSAWQSQKNVRGTMISRANVQFSYAIIKDSDEAIEIADLYEVAREINRESIDRVNTGWSMFYPFTRDPIRPQFSSDPSVESVAGEFLEANLSLDPGTYGAKDTDMWRIAPTGFASIIRPVRLDFLQSGGWSSEYFSINEAARNLAEIVRHAEAFAQRFDTAREIGFVCEWNGLADRTLGDPNHDWRPRVARIDSKVSKGTWNLGYVRSDWPIVVAKLLAPLARAFGTDLQLSSDWVTSEARGWRPMGNQFP